MVYSNVGIDIGSTTAKLVITRDGQVLFNKYVRHLARTKEKTLQLLKEAYPIVKDTAVRVMISGSAGLGLSSSAKIPYIQEVFATGELVKSLSPDTDVVIELGGEDAKIIFFKGALDERMNGSCAGGTGAFIDQMASLMDVTPDELDELSLKADQIYPIASRCGVFAKTDIQPLINQGARKEDIAASIYQAVVNQTVAGLARGRRIEGKIMFLGGPLYYNKGLRMHFTESLGLDEDHAQFPEYARYSVALGAAFCAEKESRTENIEDIIARLEKAEGIAVQSDLLPPLFASENDYEEFKKRHSRADVQRADIRSYEGNAYLGIDCGSTTTKLALIGENGELLYTYYASNKGNPVSVVKEQLINIRQMCQGVNIAACASTGYGEELVKNAFRLDFGLVETSAHLKAAKHFDPDVEFLIDIGGQDIKCFKIKDGAIDNIMLNEACSSGCGSFHETFAHTMNMSIEEFSRIGLFSKAPVNLGSRCTVFMNSSVKQAQKNGATVEDISAGLSCSVINNALYKVIRINNPDQLGRHIVVQGGTFNNDAVLRSFEMQTGRNVTRPSIAGIMGAYGAALYAKEKRKSKSSSLLSLQELCDFFHTVKSARCAGCENRCMVTVNSFSDNRKFVSGNRCEKIFNSGKGRRNDYPNVYAEKRKYLSSLEDSDTSKRAVGIPLGLNIYELAPFWHGFFNTLNMRVITGGYADLVSYSAGQLSIPSDTACYPAKLMHGQITKLIHEKPDFIFYPCMTWNIDEKATSNCYNCPLVAYYPEVIKGNMDELAGTPFLYPYIDINNEKQLEGVLFKTLRPHIPDLTKKTVKAALKNAFSEYRRYKESIFEKGKAAVEFANENDLPIMVLAGRPYHVDPLINHGIDELAIRLGFVVISEDVAARMAHMPSVSVLNQWTYHSRMYASASFVNQTPRAQLVQLVSFGCGLDAITTDEIRDILASDGKLYTQLKIDEISNLGAVTIRLRSLVSALEDRGEK